MHPLDVEHHRDGSRVNSSLEICGDGMNEDVYFCEKLNEYVMIQEAKECKCFQET